MDTQNFKTYAKLEQKKRELEQELDDVKQRLKELEPEIMEAMLNEGIRKYTVSVPTENGDTVDRTLYVHRQLWAGYQRDESGNGKNKLTEALENEGLEQLVTKGFNTQKLSAWIREFDEGGESPEEIISKLPESLQDKVKISEVTQIKTRNN